MSNLCEILKNINGGVKIRNAICWSDSTTVLHWIRNNKFIYKPFVNNLVEKINQKGQTFRHVPGVGNPADIASRGAKFHQLQNLWWDGPDWLRDEERWPADIETTTTTPEIQAEMKPVKEILNIAVDSENKNHFTHLIEKFSYKKTVRITSLIMRFFNNCSKKLPKQSGPLTTDEIESAVLQWIKWTQENAEKGSKFEQHTKQLNLKKDARGVYICVGRIHGMYPIYLPSDSIFSEKLVTNAHLATLHGGVGLTMTYVREKYWIPQLRKVTKRIRKMCYGCKRAQVTALKAPPPGNLPIDRTKVSRPFEVVGMDYAGPFVYKLSRNREAKAYLILYSCSLTRALHLEILPDQTAENFIPSLKRLIARKGRPKVIYSDNGSTFLCAAKWLKRVLKNEKTHDFLSTNDIRWKFNVSRAPWLGGQFERMVALVKQALYKVVGRSFLTWNELNEVFIDIELTLNNRPLSYVEDDIDMPILTPNLMMFGPHTIVPENDVDEDDTDLRKRARYILNCKKKVWDRWRNEYLRGLRERHNLTHNEKPNSLKIGDVMLIKGDQKNRSMWTIGVVTGLITGRDNVIRGAKLKTGKGYVLERAVQYLYPMELHCDVITPKPELSAQAPVFRPKRTAAAISPILTKEQQESEDSIPFVE